MPTMEEMKVAMTTRALRNIRTELEFLAESSVITDEQLAHILSQLPEQTSLSASVANLSLSTRSTSAAAQPSPVVSAPVPPASVPIYPVPSPQPASNPADEKRASPYPTAQQQPGPPAYTSLPSPVLSYGTALYAYNPTDVGDLALLPNDRVAIVEYTNGDWWKGRSMRTGLEGIFPAKYVRPDEAQTPAPMPPPAPPAYGNMPLAVSQGGPPTSAPAPPGRIEANGKKFGKKLGDAAIFGAGATIGSSIVRKVF